MRELLHRYKTVQSTRYWVFSGRWKCLAYMVVQRPTFFTHRLQAVRFPQTRAELRRGVCVSRAGQCGAGRAGPNSVLTSPSGANAIAFIIDIAHVVAAFFPLLSPKRQARFSCQTIHISIINIVIINTERTCGVEALRGRGWTFSNKRPNDSLASKSGCEKDFTVNGLKWNEHTLYASWWHTHPLFVTH